MKLTALIRILVCATSSLLALDARAQVEGTLFTQPEEREYLDYLREEFLRNNAENGFDIEETAIPEIPEGEVVTQTGPTEFSFGGIMARRDGSRSVWLNGRLLYENELPDGISLVAGERNPSLRISVQGNTFVLRPGQSVNLDTGTVVENFQRPQPEPLAAATPGDTSADQQEVAQPEPTTSDVVEEADAEEEAIAEAATDAESTTDTNTDAIASAVEGLDDEEFDALFEALENRRMARDQVEDESDEASEDEDL